MNGVKVASAILIVVNLVILVFVLSLYLSNPVPSVNISSLTGPKTVEIPFAVYLGKGPPVSATSLEDIDFGLTLSYPNGTLYAGEPVTITSRAVLVTKTASNISELYVSFDNALAYPLTLDQYGIPEPATVHLFPTPQNANILTGSDRVEWPTEGGYHVYLDAAETNRTGTYLFHLGQGSGVLIQVYPSEQAIAQREQAVSNQVGVLSLYLTYALIVLTIAGVLTNLKDLFAKQSPPPPPATQQSPTNAPKDEPDNSKQNRN